MRKNPKPLILSHIDLGTGRPDVGGLAGHVDALLLGLAAVCLSAILIAPLVGIREVYTLFSLICHQNPDRCWILAGQPLPTCIRCTSIYAGFGIALALRLPPVTWALRVSAALLILEVSLAGLWVDLEFARAVSALLLGLSGAGFVAEGAREMISRWTGNRNLSSADGAGNLFEHV